MHKDLLSERNGNIFHSLYKVRRLSTGANMQVGCISGGRTMWKLFSEGVYFPEKQEVISSASGLCEEAGSMRD